ncbi:MAG: TPM domain-containing protein [Nitrospirota bacterium]|nr:TPM domain-containing protein [Nitrospirota bacterium]MDP3596516.1 TPM domain-containing protein [Nitrospirota bacterium]
MSRVWRGPARLMVFLGILLMATSAWALEVPALTGRVVDLAHVLPADVAASLSRDLEAHETKTSNQVAVLILPTLEGEPLEAFSHRVGATWKLGQRGTGNGVLLLVALRERKVRIEVGYGLEGPLTDLRSAHIIRQEIVPRFRTGDLPRGIIAGVQAILGTIEGTYQAEEVLADRARSGQEPTGLQYVIIGIVVGTLAGIVLSHGLQRTRALLGSLLAFLVAQSATVGLGLLAAVVTAFLLWLILRANRGAGQGGGWGEGFMTGSGGGFGGSFGGGGGGFSGGGGDFSGGGASGDW